MTRFKTLAALWAIPLVFAGCGGGKVPDTKYYSLNLPTAPAPAARPAAEHAAVVMPFRASEMLTQDRIVYRPSQEEVGYYEYHRWAEDPRRAIEKAFLRATQYKEIFSSVVPFDGRTRSDYIIRGRLERLEEVDFEGGVKVYVTISAEMLDASNSRVVWQAIAESNGTVATKEMRDVVAGMSEAAKESIDELIDSLDAFVRRS